jgi:hypothetical protein
MHSHAHKEGGDVTSQALLGLVWVSCPALQYNHVVLMPVIVVVFLKTPHREHYRTHQ